MFRIFRKKNKHTGELQDVQLRTVEQSGVDPLEKRLEDSRRTIGKRLKELVGGHSDINEDLLEELETTLLTADIGVKAGLGIMDNLRSAIDNGTIRDPQSLLPAVQAELYELIESSEQFLVVDTSQNPFVILMVGINGAGKTTTIGKLAQRFREEGLSVMTEKFIRHLPVTDDSGVIGMVSIGDLVKAVIGDQQTLIDQLERYITH